MKSQVINYINNWDEATATPPDEATLDCKFVLLVHASCLYFVVGLLSDYRYHANLLERYCDEQSIPTAWRLKPDLLEVIDPEVRILGGGHLQIDLDRRRMKFHGVSKAYGVFHARDLAELVKTDSFFHRYSLSIDRF